MIDGLKCSCVGLNVDLWKNNPYLNFEISVSESTGEILTQRREAKVKNLCFVLSPTSGGGFSCSFNGSLHKYSSIDSSNHDDFTYSNLTKALDNLTNDYSIELDHTSIHSLEVGVNIELDYSPEIVFKKAICHKGKPFDRLDSRNKRFGIKCTHTDYAIKLYDKGYQYKINGKYILRYEIKMFRQRMLQPFKIYTLSDLKDVEKVTPLICLLLERLNEIVFFDYSFKPKGLSNSKLLSWQQYSNAQYWESLNRNNYYKARKKLAELTQKYSCIDWGKIIAKKVLDKWIDLAELKQKNRRHFPQMIKRLKAEKQATFSNLEYMLENVTEGDVKKQIKNTPKTKQKNETSYCIICGRKLTDQKQGSQFCSERIYGKEARKCRNKDSNRRLAIKRKIYKAMEKELMLRITYKVKGNEYSDILSVDEINITREWLDRIVSVEVLDSSLPKISGKEANEYLQKISK